MSRLQRFRAFVARMDPTAEPRKTLGAGLYVDPPDGGLAATLATRLELEPASTHLLVGYVGSGKSTTALKVVERLAAMGAETGDHVVYMDVSRRHRMDEEALEGVLVALVGLDLVAAARARHGGKLTVGVATASLPLSKWAQGFTEWVPYSEDDDYPDYPDDEGEEDEHPVYRVHHPGVLKPAETSLSPRFEEMVEPLRALRSELRGHAVYAFDSLDRLQKPGRFAEAVREDIRALRKAEIGSVVVGPIRFALGQDTAIRSLFDHVHFVQPPDPEHAAGLQFCCEVLRRRADANMLPDEVLADVARSSGGILRDLVGIARRAGEEAYARGADRIESSDVALAVRALGEALAFGLDAAELSVLRHLQSGAGFVIRGERELALIEQRRVVPAGVGAWRVHPALDPVLAAIPHEAA